MFVYQMSKLDLGEILFLPKLWSNLTFYIAKGFSGIISVVLNPLSPKSDQHKISPCKYQCFVKQRGHENYGLDHTR